MMLLPPATKLGQGYIFTGICDSVKGGMHGGGHVWQGVCAWGGGMHGWVACVVGGVHGKGA